MGMKEARLYGSKVVNCTATSDLGAFLGRAYVPVLVPPDVLIVDGKTFVMEVNLSPYVLYREAIVHTSGKR